MFERFLLYILSVRLLFFFYMLFLFALLLFFYMFFLFVFLLFFYVLFLFLLLFFFYMLLLFLLLFCFNSSPPVYSKSDFASKKLIEIKFVIIKVISQIFFDLFFSVQEIYGFVKSSSVLSN